MTMELNMQIFEERGRKVGRGRFKKITETGYFGEHYGFSGAFHDFRG